MTDPEVVNPHQSTTKIGLRACALPGGLVKTLISTEGISAYCPALAHTVVTLIDACKVLSYQSRENLIGSLEMMVRNKNMIYLLPSSFFSWAVEP